MSDAADNSVKIERTLAAPAATVYEMWTDGDKFASWYGPTGFTVNVVELDATVGGKRLLSMSSPDGSMTMWFTGAFTGIDSPGRLSYTDIPADDSGNALAPEAMGMPAGTPMETEVIVTLADSDGGCDMVMTHVGVPADSPGAQGWQMAIGKLEALLAG